MLVDEVPRRRKLGQRRAMGDGAGCYGDLPLEADHDRGRAGDRSNGDQPRAVDLGPGPVV